MTRQKPSAKARRSAARLAAVQALYQIALTDGDPESVLGEFVRHRFGADLDGDRYVEPEPGLFGIIVRGVTGRAGDIDGLVTGALDASWSLDRLEPLLRAILRAGAWELLANPEVPAQIVIAEYIDMTHAFFSGREPGMVNAVLDRVAHTVRPSELAAGGTGR